MMKRFMIGFIVALIMAIGSLYLLTYIPYVNDLFVLASLGNMPSLGLAAVLVAGFTLFWGGMVGWNWPTVTRWVKIDGVKVISRTTYL